MAKLKLKEEIAFHEFSVRYRAALAQKFPLPEAFGGKLRETLLNQYQLEKSANPGFGIEEAKIENPRIESPKIEAPQIEPSRGLEGPEPEL
jgi:hypothetical protein